MDAANVAKAFRGHINRNRGRVTIVFFVGISWRYHNSPLLRRHRAHVVAGVTAGQMAIWGVFCKAQINSGKWLAFKTQLKLVQLYLHD